MTGMNCGLDIGRRITACAHNLKSGGLDFLGKCSIGNHIPALEHGIGRNLLFNSARDQFEGNAISINSCYRGVVPDFDAMVVEMGFYIHAHPVRLLFVNTLFLTFMDHRNGLTLGDQVLGKVGSLEIRTEDDNVISHLTLIEGVHAHDVVTGEAALPAAADGYDHGIGVLGLDSLDINRCAGVHVNTKQLHLAGEISSQISEALMVALHGLRNHRHPAEHSGFLIEADFMAAGCRDACGFETGRTAADDHDLLRCIGGNKLISVGHLLCVGILRRCVYTAVFGLSALNAMAVEAMHAGGDFITSATLQFVRELRINGQGTGHKDNINFTVTDGVVDQIRSKPCIHYACAADRHADSLFDFCGERDESADAFMGTVHQTGPVFAVIKLGTVTGGAVGLIYTVVGVGCPAVCFQPACSYTDLDKIRACGFQCLCQILRLFGDNKLVVCCV